LFLNSDGRERKGKLPVFELGVTSSSASGRHVEGYIDDRGVVLTLSTNRGTMTILRLILVIMKSFGSFCSGKWGVSWAAAEGSGVYGNGQWLEEEQVM
jgi:hypothetical protein